MSLAPHERLLEDRRAAQLEALTQARRARRRELALVEQYLAQIRWHQTPQRAGWRALAPLASQAKR